jgi:hypothetical protein
MNVGKLKQIIQDIPNDFTIQMRVRSRLSNEQIIKSKYPYPFHTINTELEFDDVGISDKQLCLGCEIPKQGGSNEY